MSEKWMISGMFALVVALSLLNGVVGSMRREEEKAAALALCNPTATDATTKIDGNGAAPTP